MRVLIVDDEPMMRRILQRYLENWGHEVVMAEDGEAGWGLFEHGDFPIVISDWMMPKMNGLELIRRIRSSPRADETYTILLTAKSHKDDLAEGMDAGADDFLSKPFERDELRVRLREGERIAVLERALKKRNGAISTDGFGGTLEQCVGQIAEASSQIVAAEQRNPEAKVYLQEALHRLDCARRLLSSMMPAVEPR